MLNLKNDGLRKKYDSIKYDLRRIEGVIYDLRCELGPLDGGQVPL